MSTGGGPERLRRVRDLFDVVVEKATGERRAFLEEAAGCDQSLRDEVLALLADEEAARGFLSRPAVVPESMVPTGSAAPHAPLAGRRIGPYRLLDEIGHGGMGTVYRAVRADDTFHKTVALKLVRSAAATDLVQQRFLRERQILGRLQHPNIATVFDGGTTEEGQPYLVMEHVDGEPVDRYCAAREVPTRARLEMFLQVCAAVQYAHQNLVVHRDLKPGNILVTEDGTPKLLDFGIAKLLAGGVDPENAPTATMLPLMTPEYASPEQVKGETVTTASDVYSLGVVLYELLTGRRPYTVRTESLEEIVRAVCLTEPMSPSTAVRSASGTTRPVPASELRGDLDTIVLKALRKEPARRYPSVQELAEDIRRHLDGRPVLARGDSPAYRMGKFVSRHRFGVGSAALVGLSLVGGIVMTVRQARIAEAQRQRAERRFADVRKLANSFMFDIHDEIRDLAGSTRARQRLVATAREYLDSLAQEAHGDAGLQRELAAAYERVADVAGGIMSGNVGDTQGALENYRKALDLRETIAAGDRVEPDDSIGHARLELRLGDVLRTMNRLAEAERTYGGATSRLETAASSSGASRVRRDLANAYQKLAQVQVDLGRAAAAPGTLGKAIEHGEAARREDPEDTAVQLNLAGAYYTDAERLRGKGEYTQALERTRQAGAIQEALVRKDPSNELLVRALLFSLNRQGVNLEFLDRRPEAIRVYRRAVDIAVEMARRNPGDRWSQMALLVGESTLGNALVQAGQVPAALPWLRRARASAAAIIAADPANGFVRNELAVVDVTLGEALLAQGSRQQGCRALARSRETWRRMQAEGPVNTDTRDNVRRLEARIAASCPGAGD